MYYDTDPDLARRIRCTLNCLLFGPFVAFCCLRTNWLCRPACLLLLLIATLPTSFAGDLVKYKTHLTEVCQQVDSKLERVIYIDDVGFWPEDPNGAQEIPLILGLDNKVELLAIGTETDGSNKSLVETLVSKANRSTPVLTGSDLENFIISEALKMRCSPTGKKLFIAIGGEWSILKKAIDADSEIAQYISVVGIGGYNIGRDSDGMVIPPINQNTKHLNYTAIDENQDINTVVTIQDIKLEGKPKSPNFRSAYKAESDPYNKAGLDNWYDTHFKTTDSGAYVDTSTWGTSSIPGHQGDNHTFPEEAAALNGAEVSGGSKLRIADFFTVAYIAFTNSDIFSKAIMYPKLQTALARLPRK